MTRYVYIKYGDAYAQLEELRSSAEPTFSGPNAFIADLIREIGNNPILIISCAERDIYNKTENITSRIFKSVYKNKSKLFQIAQNFLAAFKAFKLMMEYNPNRIICGRSGEMLWIAYLVAKLKSIPLVHARHNRVNSDKVSYRRKIAEFIDKMIIRRITGVICHGPYLRRQLIEIGVPEYRIYEFDQGLGDFVSERKENAPYGGRKKTVDEQIILFVGRVEKEKGIFDLLDACCQILKNSDKFVLYFAGSGYGQKQLELEIKKNNLSDKAKLLGKVNHDQIATLLKKAKVVITPTRSSFPEGRCMVVMESLAMGTPVIAPNFGPFPFLITDCENGLLFEPNSKESLRQNINKLLNDDLLYSKLKIGASKSQKKLLNTGKSFGLATTLAFNQCEKN